MLDYDALKTWELSKTQTYAARDTMLYALGVGLGADPLDEQELRFVFEQELLALPTMSAVLCHPGVWVREPRLGLDWLKVMHGEHHMTFHAPLPPSGTVEARYRNTAVVDKGEGRGALLCQEKQVFDAQSGALVSTTRALYFARGDGGFSAQSGVSDPSPQAPPTPPDTPSDAVCELATIPRIPLIYRLSGDYMPVHADPAAARKAGFPRPFMHGLCTYGMAAQAILKTFCDYDPSRLASLGVRFTAPWYPGETLRTEFWRTGDQVAFRSRAVERDVIVLNNGTALLQAGR
jgi:acyl dehydratase